VSKVGQGFPLTLQQESQATLRFHREGLKHLQEVQVPLPSLALEVQVVHRREVPMRLQQELFLA
jgi:hypothetical protein